MAMQIPISCNFPSVVTTFAVSDISMLSVISISRFSGLTPVSFKICRTMDTKLCSRSWRAER